MVEQKEWVFFKQIDFDCPHNNKFNVDTRDFHCGYYFTEEKHPDYNTLIKYNDFFFTKEELESELERLFVESGGEGKWRFLSLNNTDGRVLNWNLKYIRIWRTEKGFIVCNNDDVAIRKNILSSSVNQEYLYKH